MNSLEENKLDNVINHVINTLAFYGVTIVSMELPNKAGKEAAPTFRVEVSKKNMKKSLEDTLDITYWTLWTLIYGKYEENTKDIINLDYKLVS